MFYRSLILVVLLLSCFEVCATHIVGGVIYYEHIEGRRYKLTFEVYRDCSPGVVVGFDGTQSGNPNTQLPPFYFSIFEGNVNANIAYNYNELFNPNILEIRPVIVNPCLKVDKNTCVERGIYETTVTLPRSDIGYTIQHMRCCRNDGILNIKNQQGSSDKPGFTLRTYIPPSNTTPNSSARFKELPPIFICENQTFYFDHSATDKDGDVLRYSLASPLEGLSSDEPVSKSQTLNVNPVEWSNGYSLNNVMGGSPAMSIDSVTGMLVCKPNRVGRFVVSILVKEIRNGIVIDSFARDFQYNVVDCDIPNANSPFVPGTYDPQKDIGVYILCGDFEVNFTNTSTNADRYEWNFGDPASGASNTSTDVNPTHIFTDTGTFIVTLRAFKRRLDGRLCFDTTRRICKVYPKVGVAFDYIKPGVCVDEPVQFTDKSPSTSGIIVGWKWNFGDGSTSTLQNPNHTFSSSGIQNVKLTVTNPVGCESDTILPIEIFPKPNIAATVPNGCLGQLMDLKCNVTIPSPNTITDYRWTLPDATTFTVCNFGYTPTSLVNSTIRLWAKSNRGCVDSADFPFVVSPLPNVRAFKDTVLCYDYKTEIFATGANTYEWTPATYLSNANASPTIASPPYPDSIIYMVKGTDDKGCYNFDSIKLTFFEKSFIDAGPDTSICLPPSARARDFVQLNGQGAFNSVYWTPVASLDNSNIANPTARPSQNTDYIFHGIDSNQCLIKDTVRVIVLDPNANLILQNDSSICEGDSILVNPLDQGDFSSYSWVPDSAHLISDPMIRTPYLKPSDTTLFILTVANYCYQKSDSINVIVFPKPDVGLIALDSICFGESYQFMSNPSHVSYNWVTTEPSFSNTSIYNPIAEPKTSQTYVLHVIDTHNCRNTDSIRLNVNPIPYTSVLGNPRYICQGDSIELTLLTNQESEYTWRTSPYLSSDSGRVVKAFPFDTTEFYFYVTNIHDCTYEDSFYVNVQKPIQPYGIRPVRICKGKFIDLYVEGGLYYLWQPAYNINDTLSQRPQVSPDSFFTYTAYISNDCFMDSLKVDVYVDSLPVVDLGKDTSIYRGQQIELYAETKAKTVEWFPKSELISNPFVRRIYVSPMDTTMYFVEATDGFGCVGTDSIYVFVYGKNVLLIPTGFSPNGDGINDRFGVVKHLNIRNLSYFNVYNRWGELVYSTTDIESGWDGFYKGNESPAGVYVWHVEAYSYDNEKLTQSGNVTLIR